MMFSFVLYDVNVRPSQIFGNEHRLEHCRDSFNAIHVIITCLSFTFHSSYQHFIESMNSCY